MVRSVTAVRTSAKVGYGAPDASMPRLFFSWFATASTQPWWPPSALYAIWKLPLHGEMASASAQSFLASSASKSRTSEPGMSSE